MGAGEAGVAGMAGMASLDRAVLAAVLAAAASASLLIGAALGLYVRAPQRVIAAVMAFGSGALIQALAVELAFGGARRLTEEHRMPALEAWLWVAGGFIAGGLVYYEANRWIERRGGHLRKPARMKAHLFGQYLHLPHVFHHAGRPAAETGGTAVTAVTVGAARDRGAAGGTGAAGDTGAAGGTGAAAAAGVAGTGAEAPVAVAPGDREQTPAISVYEHGAERRLRDEHRAQGGSDAPVAIFLGALLDGIPESVVIGASFTTLAAFNPTFLVAVFLSNLPEALSSAAGMRRAGFSRRRVMGLWGGLVAASAVAAALGNLFFAEAAPTLLTFVEALAGGGILAMLAATMMPEAYEHGGPSVGLSTIAGFLSAFYFSAGAAG